MFVQVIQGRAKDAAGLRKEMDRWVDELMPGADGYLGTTAGVSDDGEFIGIARFETAEAARRNSDRPEQGAWWSDLLTHLEGAPTVHDCTEVDLMMSGGSDAAGFVQFIQGRTTDREKLRRLEAEAESWMKENRPDLIGGVTAWHPEGGGSFTEAAYFTSETEAREGEKKMDETMTEGEWQGLVEDMRYVDLRDPWLVTR